MEIISSQRLTKPRYNLCKYIILTGFIAGSLDALAAIYILSHGNAQPIFKYISSGIYGSSAFTGGAGMVLLGVALHYFIAFSFTVFYFTTSGYARIFQKNIFLSAIIYGLFIYVVMNLIVFSLCNIHVVHRNTISIVRNSVILMICVAFPIVYAKRLYNSKG
ncbi:MAG: hypothetical protein ACHQHN_02920 [Sphingobacteriales bacterium]